MSQESLYGSPISFTREEIAQARQGNYGPAERRVKKELAAKSRRLRLAGRPRTVSEIRKTAAHSEGKAKKRT